MSSMMKRRTLRTLGFFLQLFVTPLLMGGCPEFQNQTVDAFETAFRSVIDSAVTLFFDQFRSI